MAGGDPVAALAGRVRAIDLGIAHGPWGRRAFIESVGVGALAAAERRAHEAARRDGAETSGDYGSEGKVARGRRLIAEGLADAAPMRARVLDPNGSAVSNDALVFLEALNLARTGPSLELAPDAVPDDGSLDVVLGDAAGAAVVRAACGNEGTTCPGGHLPVERRRRLDLLCFLSELRIDGEFGADIVGSGPRTGGREGAKAPTRERITVEVLPGALLVVVPSA